MCICTPSDESRASTTASRTKSNPCLSIRALSRVFLFIHILAAWARPSLGIPPVPSRTAYHKPKRPDKAQVLHPPLSDRGQLLYNTRFFFHSRFHQCQILENSLEPITSKWNNGDNTESINRSVK
ncbi:hypothetical protein BOTBODRAFT_196491 [Botryobasidium botryosum FD-172 SS1]|uniref:Uncharacterized protein n=1 Tax=Botryobasidium botryosum (strain FD-172 SS1) TaxID=930990 RepID=A0A067NAV0_BOTB1|nr:hypothetical protein BOTBODRAFT_196491 [Botryobasidium botryosum FD-172 SS1]